MFCTLNTTSVVLASILSGIDYIDEILFRIIGLIISIVISSLLLFWYYKKISKNPEKSIVYDKKKEIADYYSIQTKKKNKEEKEGKEKNKEEKDDEDEKKDEENKKDEKTIDDTSSNREGLVENDKKIKFDLKEIISLVLLVFGFIFLILGVLIFKWSFMQMTTLF